MSRCRPGRCSPRTTSTPGSSCRSTPARRPSRSPGGRCSSSTIPTSQGRTPTISRNGSTSPTTGSPTRRCGRATTTSGIPAGVPPSRVGGRRELRTYRGPARRGQPPHAGRSNRPRPSSATSPASGASRPTSSTACRSPSPRRSRSSRRSRASSRPTRPPPSRASSDGSRTRFRRPGRWDAPTRDAALGYAHELLLGPFLDAHLSEPFRERVRERLARGWESAIDQPRYGPNTDAVRAAIERLRTLGPSDLQPARGRSPADRPRLRGRAGSPRSTTTRSGSRPRSPSATRPPRCPIRCRRCFAARSAGRCTAWCLRHAFKPAELARLVGPWSAVLPVEAPKRPAAKRA